VFDIGQCGIICDMAEQAREMTPRARSGGLTYRDADGLINFTVAGEEFALSMETSRPAANFYTSAIWFQYFR
jgi:hypothetical protein